VTFSNRRQASYFFISNIYIVSCNLILQNGFLILSTLDIVEKKGKISYLQDFK
jgi:hypothetical protein